MTHATTTLSDVVNTLTRLGCQPTASGSGYAAYCPIHEIDDHNHTKSLTVGVGHSVPVVVHCHAGCDSDGLLKILDFSAPERSTISSNPVRSASRPRATAHRQSTKSTIRTIYAYFDADGHEIRQKVRLEPKDFRIRHKEGDEWVHKAGSGPAVLYRLPEVHRAVTSGDTVYLCEGEKDVDRLVGLGSIATTNIEGASLPGKKPKWRREYTQQLTGAVCIVLLPDNDEAGRAHMAYIAQQLMGQVGEIILMDLGQRYPELKAKGDVSDWLNAGHTIEELQEQVGKATPLSKPLPSPPIPIAEAIAVGVLNVEEPPSVANRIRVPREVSPIAKAIEFGVKTLGAFEPDGLVCLATDEESATRIFEAMEVPVIAAGSALALWKTARDIRDAYPHVKVLVCGDMVPGETGVSRAAAFSLIGGSYWCDPSFLRPTNEELTEVAGPNATKEQIKAAIETLKLRDSERGALEMPTSFNDLSGWFNGVNRLKEQIWAAINEIGVIRIVAGQLSNIVDRAEKETLFYGAEFYQRVGMLVRPVKQDVSTERGGVRLSAGALVLNQVNVPWLVRRFSQAAKWKKYEKREAQWFPADPPSKYAETYLSMSGEWRVPVLKGIVECPTLRRDG